MIISISIIILSFLLDGFLSVYQLYIDYFPFLTLFTISSLVLIYPLLALSHHRYFQIALIMGLIYDLVYTNTLFLNIILFWLLAVIIKYVYTFFTYHLLNSILLNMFIIIIYQFLIFTILVLLNYISLNFNLWWGRLPYLIIVNNFYFIIMYLMIRKICHKRSLKIIN